MYQLANSQSYQYTGPDIIYVLDILPVSSGLAAISSDQRLCLFDPLRLSQGPTRTLQTTHGNIASLSAYDATDSIVGTCGENGTVTLWDLRLDGSRSQVAHLGGGPAPAVSLACSSSLNAVAAGTEFADHQASILIWDARSPSVPRIQYHEVHSDDVTELKFHPADGSILLSGSTDGLVNVCDTKITDEDEVVIQTFNHGSVHHAGFLNNTEVYVLSHDEKFALYDMAEDQEKGSATLDFGDVRQRLNSQYVANVFPKDNGAGAVLGAGAQDHQMFQLFHMSKGASWSLDTENSVGLPGAHGSELVRSFCFFDEQQVVFTAGEDGQIKSWSPSG